MIRCSFCGRDNDDAARHCHDCGKPLAPSAARVLEAPSQAAAIRVSVPAARESARAGTGGGGGASLRTPCRYCSTPVDPTLPFCPRCGGRVAAAPPVTTSTAACAACGNAVVPGQDVFCARCGARVATETLPPPTPAGTAAFAARSNPNGPRIAILDSQGQVSRTVTMEGVEATIGRADGELRFGDDVFMSPVHAQLSFREGQLYVRDLGSRNGTWLYQTAPYKLNDGDTMLVGSQLIRFRRLGYPGPNPPEADATRRLGSATPSADVAVLQQLRADGSARDSCHLSPSRTVVIGRADGDWKFPYDMTMSGRHAEVRSEDLDFIVLDLGSRNGVAIAVRGEKPVQPGQRLLIGDQTLRVESV